MSSSPEPGDLRRSLSASETRNEMLFDGTPRRAPSMEDLGSSFARKPDTNTLKSLHSSTNGRAMTTRSMQQAAKASGSNAPSGYRKQPAVFSLENQMLSSIGSPECPTPWSPLRVVKRVSEPGSGDDTHGKKGKRVRKLLHSIQDSPSRYQSDEEDSISLPSHVDPKTLCPYCDLPLPSSPSPLLLRLLGITKLKSQKDARPSNPLGRKAPLAVFATVCQRHRFEAKILPEAEKKGWPKTINWKTIEGRIINMKPQLNALITSNEDSDGDAGDWEVLTSIGKPGKKERSKSVFWDELLAGIKKNGLKSIGQFENFEKVQPGYYGELGSDIIYHTLQNIFPPTSIDAASIAPITTTHFIQHVLVPEVALRLIMEDQGLKGDAGLSDGLSILRESSAYGVAMFPEDSNEPGKREAEDKMEDLGVGDRIVMERARKRRKELEQEEIMEREEEERGHK